jgi:hypothetical protein
VPKKKKQSEPNVCEETSQTLEQKTSKALAVAPLNGEFVEEPADIALVGDPAAMNANELADIVIQGFGKLRPYKRYIAELHHRFRTDDRDENKHLLEPIKDCYTFSEFCTKHLDRSARAIYHLLRDSDPEKKLPKSAQPQLPATVCTADLGDGHNEKTNSKVIEEALERAGRQSVDKIDRAREEGFANGEKTGAEKERRHLQTEQQEQRKTDVEALTLADLLAARVKEDLTIQSKIRTTAKSYLKLRSLTAVEVLERHSKHLAVDEPEEPNLTPTGAEIAPADSTSA